MTTVITEANLSNVRVGVRTFVRLFGLETDPLYAKHASGETDIYDALDCIKIMMHGTERMIGKQKHFGKPFDFVADVKEDMREMMLVGDDAPSTATKRKRNLALYHLVVDPIVETFRAVDHATAIKEVDTVIEYIASTAFTEDDYGSYDDALVAQVQAHTIIRNREEQYKAEAAARKKKGRKEAHKTAAELEDIPDNTDDE